MVRRRIWRLIVEADWGFFIFALLVTVACVFLFCRLCVVYLFICFFFFGFSFGLLGILDYEFLFFYFFCPFEYIYFFLCPLNIFSCILIKKFF